MGNAKSAYQLAILCLLFSFCLACNPYAGFKGVNKKGMSNNKAPSQELKEDYKKSTKRMNRKYKREMKRRKKRMGSQPKKTP
ncbi:MAG: hypothetical protein RIC95_10810 [Vicingaceae bacterium]